MLQLRENRSFTVRFVAVAAALTGVVSLFIQSIPIGLEIPVLLRFLGLVSFVAWLVSTLLNRWLWRARPFSWILRIPDFSGRWEGWYRHETNGPWRETAHEISQSALDVDAEAWGPENWARGTCSSIIVASPDLTLELVWAYKAEPTTASYKPGDTHSGVHFLRMVERDDGRLLLGRYINDRAHENGKGVVGEIQLRWVRAKLQHELNFKEGSWGLKKPTV